jgi:hypothetical protein
MKSIAQLSKMSGIPILDIKRALGKPLKPCLAKTKKQAWAAYRNTVVGSEEEAAAIATLVRFISTIAEIKALYKDVTGGSEVERIVAARWDEILLQQIASATYEEALAAWNTAPPNGSAEGEAIRKMWELF